MSLYTISIIFFRFIKHSIDKLCLYLPGKLVLIRISLLNVIEKYLFAANSVQYGELRWNQMKLRCKCEEYFLSIPLNPWLLATETEQKVHEDLKWKSFIIGL